MNEVPLYHRNYPEPEDFSGKDTGGSEREGAGSAASGGSNRPFQALAFVLVLAGIRRLVVQIKAIEKGDLRRYGRRRARGGGPRHGWWR